MFRNYCATRLLDPEQFLLKSSLFLLLFLFPLSPSLFIAAERKENFPRPIIPEAQEMVLERLVPTKMLSNVDVLQSMMRTDRAQFVPKDMRGFAFQDITLPIGASQTISPPFVVAYMTETLDPQPTDKVLEIGTGSGYQAAVLAPLVQDVYTVEIIPSLGKQATETLKKLGYDNVKVRIGDGYQGWSEYAPFNKIIVTCSPENIPQPLIDQLAEGGKLLIPVGERYHQFFYLCTKKGDTLEKETLIPAYFVPMTGEAEEQRQIQPDPSNPSIVCGGFETVIANDAPDGWYYTRNAKVTKDYLAPEGESVIVFDNREVQRAQQMKDAQERAKIRGQIRSGTQGDIEEPEEIYLDIDPLTERQRIEELTSHILQGFPIDGRKVKKIRVSCQMESIEMTSFDQFRTVPVGRIVFFDDNRKAIGSQIVLAVRLGTTRWREYVTDNISVPREAREGSLCIGILNGVGVLKVDDVRLEKVTKTNTSKMKTETEE